MDDDLVLNVDVGHDTANTARSSHARKGGRWTDRLKAKRVSKRKIRPSDNDVDETPAHAVESRPAKRPRHIPESQKEIRKDSVPSKSTSTQSRAPAQFISSLFTSNPKVEAPVAGGPKGKQTAAPSNAPLADSSTFAGLGLDPLLVTHLSSKMNILKPTSIQKAALPPFLLPSPENVDRDVFIQSQTGSGKTLSFLLPILQDLLPLSTNSYIDRSIGTLAIIIAPTRELAKQIHDVLEALLKLRLRPEEESAADSTPSSARLTRWLVSGLLTGGATRTHEKARIRKGLPIVVATPGRLLDHLQNTSTFNVEKCRWLVLDEADRLMDLGFEETITGIVRGLDGRRNLAKQAVEEGKSTEVGGWDWSRQRRTVLCSATIREDVQKLAGTTLTRPIVIKATEADMPVEGALDAVGAVPTTEKFTPPSQLSQKYVVVPLKLRLVALVALLRFLLSKSSKRPGESKIIVFLSCTDSVDFHWQILGGTAMNESNNEQSDGESDDDDESGDEEAKPRKEKVSLQSPLLPDASIYRLHGSLPTPTRLASLRAFSAVGKGQNVTSSILLCTSVASRGLDLPLVRAVVQYDLPTEGGATEYVHRVGRTARAGKGGEAWSIVSPSEAEWAKWVVTKMHGTTEESENKSIRITPISVENVLRDGFGGKSKEYEDRATEVQLAFERWVLRRKEHGELARKAYLSHMRAYSTHPTNEKHIFHIRHLHLGHLAKSFALRDAPNAVAGKTNKSKNNSASKSKSAPSPSKQAAKIGTQAKPTKWEIDHSGDAEKRMQTAVRAQGRLLKQKGVMMSSGVSEFQIPGGTDLVKLVQGAR
ncbi:ATP-dependent RNA helicase dbp7 [Pleurotus ostreatus]|uniref:ATP-dependent RNA helicase n=1 Tax=Pleurotus ostreatus TaxID=5322 RepID=A0A8H7DRP0_PLEOS|nr:ATP-dependent RNA helicase dbp7 [Pleurotus ostreatus]KAF7428209.1 ATP-dependent RNA helicase dbp7 [Pleurotus ostreatus]KAJ8696295.1 ATP-dependent RNA helicase dbp7 [Pleurotus ostreatus]